MSHREAQGELAATHSLQAACSAPDTATGALYSVNRASTGALPGIRLNDRFVGPRGNDSVRGRRRSRSAWGLQSGRDASPRCSVMERALGVDAQRHPALAGASGQCGALALTMVPLNDVPRRAVSRAGSTHSVRWRRSRRCRARGRWRRRGFAAPLCAPSSWCRRRRWLRSRRYLRAARLCQ